MNTPRLITDQDNNPVWQWANSEPFGNNAPNENPAGLGNFTHNPRFAGQYFDKETGLHYNYYRDYDPATGRYVEFDPIGLRGGLNGFTYVEGNPLGLNDPEGLSPLPSQTPPTNPNAISGPYNAPQTLTDKMVDKAGDFLVKKATGVGGIVTKSKIGLAISLLLHIDPAGSCSTMSCQNDRRGTCDRNWTPNGK